MGELGQSELGKFTSSPYLYSLDLERYPNIHIKTWSRNLWCYLEVKQPLKGGA